MGKVMNIQPFSTDDGPGIRTVLFLKGCPLSCAWCHNPESQRARSEIAYDARRCVGCGACAAVCERHVMEENRHRFDRNGCEGCGKCASVCGGALECIGAEMSAVEAVEKVMRDADFFRTSGGGVTISGGEPLAQAEFCAEILKICKAKDVHTCVETSCFGTWSVLEKLMPYVNLFLCDWKLTDDALHREYVGVSNRSIRENILRLAENGKKIRLRCPIIPGVNDTDEQADLIAKKVKGMPAHINLIPLNEVEESPLKPSRRVAAFQKRLESHGLTATVRRKLGGDIDASCGQLRRKAMKEAKMGDTIKCANLNLRLTE
jgi:pyruvate formate lyase activating enzyme